MSGVCKYKAYDNVLVLSHSGFRGVENLVAARRAPARRQNSQSPRWSCFRHFTGTHALSAAKLTFATAKIRVRDGRLRAQSRPSQPAKSFSARACPMRGGKAPSGAGGGGAGSASTGGAGLHFSIFSRSQATPPVLAPSFWDRPCVPAGDHFPTPHPLALWWNMVLGLCSCTAGGKLAAEALREIKDAIR